MAIREKVKSVLAWLGGIFVVVAGALVGLLLLRRRPSPISPAPVQSDLLGVTGEKALVEAQAQAAQQTVQAEARHAAASQALETKVAVEGGELSSNPAALADALKSKARS